ncbi:hypothetical protein DVW87_03700 [Sphingomonas aracearum]|uniref:AbiTii domain-containing protein n=1 Tax=Sphingomonas aracearum TaxID=2283317 RepID=A0A369W0A6_9SPHN|nr:hypothetical protein DVW87_03700 [Sphingomonas aracearum]
MSLVEEIQAGALNRDVPVADLLRRVKLAAAKLKLTETLDWVDSELNGYGGEDKDLPEYRVAAGSLYVTTFHHGTRPATGDPHSIAMLSMSFFREPVASLEALLTSQPGTITMPINPDLARAIKNHGHNASYAVHFSKNVLVSIVDTVRNLILDWAINLENEGILGEGVSFTVDEKQKAAQSAPNIQINNYGHYHQGDTHGHQNRTTIGGVDASTNSLTIDVFEQLQSAVTNNIDNAADRDALLELIKQMDEKKGTGGFKEVYTNFLVSAANHMTVIAPFLPALASYLPG